METESAPTDSMCPWCQKPPQRYRNHDTDRDPRGELRVSCVTYQCVLNSIDFSPEEWNTRTTQYEILSLLQQADS